MHANAYRPDPVVACVQGYALLDDYRSRPCGAPGELAQALARRMRAQVGAEVWVSGVDCDVASPASVQRLVDGALSQMGSIDVWVNNAGCSGSFQARARRRPAAERSLTRGCWVHGVIVFVVTGPSLYAVSGSCAAPACPEKSPGLLLREGDNLRSWAVGTLPAHAVLCCETAMQCC